MTSCTTKLLHCHFRGGWVVGVLQVLIETITVFKLRSYDFSGGGGVGVRLLPIQQCLIFFHELFTHFFEACPIGMFWVPAVVIMISVLVQNHQFHVDRHENILLQSVQFVLNLAEAQDS